MGSKKKRMGKAARYARKSEGAAKQEEDYSKCPHSFVFHRGQVGRSIMDLVSDMRRVMEPFTASGLKVRQRNTLKDLVSVAGPLNVTHFLSFTHPPAQPNDDSPSAAVLRVVRLPRGPTLTFRVDMYTLSRDVVSAQRRPNTEARQYRHHPLLIMNGFSSGDSHLKMMSTMFQNMFPSINVNKVKLNDIRRCILLNYNADSKTIDFRHYNVRAAPVGMSRGVKKLVRSKVPDLGACKDISDFLMKDGNLSESEAEMDGPHNEVILPQDLSSRGNIKSAKSALRLTEVGPRMTLQLVKIEAGMCAGDVLFHEFVHKTPEELEAMKAARLKKQQLKAERTRKQKENIQKKAKQKEEHREKSLKGMKAKQEQESAEASETVAAADDEKTDQQYYTEEVGEEPEMGLFSATSNAGKRKRGESPRGSGKRPRLTKNKADDGKPSKQPVKPMTAKTRQQKQKGAKTERKKDGKRWEKPTGQKDETGVKRPKKKPLNEMEKIMKYKMKKKKITAMKSKRKVKGRKQR